MAVFKIGEFSKLVRVSARMLRYYDKSGIFIPAEVDPFTGYRLYSSKQIPLLMKIVMLRDMGFGVEEIEEMLPHYDDRTYMQKALEQKRKQINAIMIAEQSKLDQIAAMNEKLKKEQGRMIYEVELKEIPAILVLSLREIIPTFEEEFGQWDKMTAFIRKYRIDCVRTGYSIYHDSEYKDAEVDVEIAFPVNVMGEDRDGFVYKELKPIRLAATIRFPLPYTNYNKAMQKLAMWLEENDYEIIGCIRGVGTGEAIVELQIPVKKK